MEAKEEKKKAANKVANRKTGPIQRPKLDVKAEDSIQTSTIDAKASLGISK
jgi:hypothetical protein